ncbi:MAG: bifunctional adenosylcobinamide kinase/adenosylcobinamide-phosphate guanylyltransferase [Ktedonobacterales bacterium]
MSNHDSPLQFKQPKRLVLILGGARSGKSTYAEALARRMTYSSASSPALVTGEHTPLVYLATATAPDGDEEMRQRILDHKRSRGDGWLTIEEAYDPAGALTAGGQLDRPGVVVLLDCLTLLVSNLLLGGPCAEEEAAPAGNEQIDWPARAERVEKALDDLLSAYHRGVASLICVTNEVGMGLVPAYPLGRVYRDILGRANARVAREANEVLFMLAGLPIEVKSLANAWEAAATQRLALDR